jgi:hypothetical protein
VASQEQKKTDERDFCDMVLVSRSHTSAFQLFWIDAFFEVHAFFKGNAFFKGHAFFKGKGPTCMLVSRKQTGVEARTTEDALNYKPVRKASKFRVSC